MTTTAQVVMSLRPGIEWSMSGDDVAGITWHTPDVEPLTQAEVTKEMKRLEAAAVTTEANRQAALQAARTFALSLGFTQVMLDVMYPQLTEAPSE
jgi:hypothetical protein